MVIYTQKNKKHRYNNMNADITKQKSTTQIQRAAALAEKANTEAPKQYSTDP